MSDQDARAAIQQAKINEDGVKLLRFESVIVGLIVGFRAESWAAGIFVFLGALGLLYVMAASEKLGSLFAYLIGAGWFVLAFWVVLSWPATILTAFAFALVFGIAGVTSHLAGFQYIRDIQKAKG